MLHIPIYRVSYLYLLLSLLLLRLHFYNNHWSDNSVYCMLKIILKLSDNLQKLISYVILLMIVLIASRLWGEGEVSAKEEKSADSWTLSQGGG